MATDSNPKELLDAVTGEGMVAEPTQEHHQEARRLIDDPDIPKSDLRGIRDLEQLGLLNNAPEENPDAWDAK